MALVAAGLALENGAVAGSTVHGALYRKLDLRPGQAAQVFLGGCGLPERWAGRPAFTVLETGFGAGLNFLATWAAWRADPARSARLDCLSVEPHPFSVADLAILHAQWPEFATLSAGLRAAWPEPVPGFHRLSLDGGRVRLTLLFGETLDCLSQIDRGNGADAIYLDGVVSGNHADGRASPLLAVLAKLARPGALLASPDVTGPLCSGLGAAGFVCETRPGFESASPCLRAERVGDASGAQPALPRTVAVIGAGVAGASIAHALAQRGVDVTVFDTAGPGAGASGNPVAVFRPMLARADTLAVRLTRAACLHDLAHWGALSGVAWSRCGVLHLPKNAADAAKLGEALAFHAPPAGFARAVTRDEAQALSGWPVADGGVFFGVAGWVVPGSLIAGWLAGIELRSATCVASLQEGEGGWTLFDAAGAVLATADAVVLANAADAAALCPEAGWPMGRVRGQVTRFAGPPLPACVVAREGYAAPVGGEVLVGATYEHDVFDTEPRAAGDDANRARLYGLLPEDIAGPARVAGHRAALRATLPDRLPLLGRVSGREGLWVAAGYASRGVVWAGLLAETLADALAVAPAPIERDLAAALDPARFIGRSGSRARA